MQSFGQVFPMQTLRHIGQRRKTKKDGYIIILKKQNISITDIVNILVFMIDNTFVMF